MKRIVVFLALMLSVAAFAKISVNKSIRIEAGERRSGGCSTVNGSIKIEPDAHLGGSCKTVNGSITLDHGCVVDGLSTVNGVIRVGKECEIKDDISSVNGAIRCAEGVVVDGSVKTVNGAIRLQGVEVQGGISTYNGDVTLENGSVVFDDVIVKDTKGNDRCNKPLEIVIDNSFVRGDVINRDDKNKVVVYLLNGGDVKGKIRNAKVERD